MSAGAKSSESKIIVARWYPPMPGRRTPLMGTLAGGRGKRNLACDYFPLAEGGHSSREPK